MPRKIPSPCRHQGCPNLVEGGGYCEIHKRHRYQEDNRPGARERGYDRRWEKVRAMYLRRHPLCEWCEKQGRITPATMVHHVNPISQGGAALDMGNLMAVCRRCHDVLHSKG